MNGAGRDRGGADVAELPAGGAELTGGLRDREIQCEPPVRAGLRSTVEEFVREKT